MDQLDSFRNYQVHLKEHYCVQIICIKDSYLKLYLFLKDYYD